MKRSSSFRKYISLSVLVHVLVLGGLVLFGDKTGIKATNNSVSIELLSSAELVQLTKAERYQQKHSISKLQNQIVEQSDQSINKKEPIDARFLSARNQTVTKQSIAAQKGQFQNLKKLSAPQSTLGNGKIKSESQHEPQVLTDSNRHDQVTKNLFNTYDPAEALERQAKKSIKEKNLAGGKGLGNGDLEATTASDLSRSNDYVKDVDTGLETMLNTREFKYYSYYNRIRRQLTQHWEGRVREKLTKMFREGRTPASSGQDRITKLMILLDEKGTLVRVQVLMDSGIHDLDDAAIDAFRAAAPFPNPPKGIIENDGTVKIRWDFVLES